MLEYFRIRRNSKAVAFNPISQLEEDCESLNSNDETKNSEFHPRRAGVSTAVVSTLVIASIITSWLLGIWVGRLTSTNNSATSTCNEYGGEYSPLTNGDAIPYHTVQYNGSLMKENVFRQSAGPEVDAAWSSLGIDYRAAILPASLAEKSGLAPSYVHVSEKYGGGYPVNVEGLHHLHCLNLVRKSLYYNYDYYHALGEGAFQNSDDIVRYHVSHCLDIIRQQLMCHVDGGVLGQIWWNKEQPQAFPDFNTVHQCRDFETVRQWAEKYEAPAEAPRDYLVIPQRQEVLESIP